MERHPIHVDRAPISVTREHIFLDFKVGTMPVTGVPIPFNRPADTSPPNAKCGNMERVLWCPWCGAYTVFKKDTDDRSMARCMTAGCWGNTGDFYVKMANDLWWENVPLADVKKLVSKVRQ